MRENHGFYQPQTDLAKILWMFWLSFFLISPVWASELFYNVDGWWLAYTLVMAAIGMWTYFGRRIYLVGQVLIFRQPWLMKKKKVDLSQRDVQYFFHQRTLILTIDNQEKSYHLSKKMVRTLKGAV